MKLTTLCDQLLQSRRWKLLPVGLAAVLLTPFLPVFLRLIAAALLLMLAALFFVYLHQAPAEMAAVYTRVPSPADAQAETIMIDASLLDEGTRVRCASQPIDSMPELSLRMGSGALLLGAAMTLLSQEMSPTDSAAVLSAVKSLNIRNSLLRTRSPILSREVRDGITSITVQDGQSKRLYYMGEPLKLAALCGTIHEGRVRYISHNDRERIQDTARYMATGGCRVIAYATAASGERPTFLGMAGLGDGVRMDAIHHVNLLRRKGYTILLREDGAVPVNMEALRTALELPEINARPDLFLCAGTNGAQALPDPGNPRCLTILPAPGMALTEPVLFLPEYFRKLEQGLVRLATLLGLCMLGGLAAGSALSMIASTLLLLTGWRLFGLSEDQRRIRPVAAGVTAAASVMCGLFLQAAAAEAAAPAGTFMCLFPALSASLQLYGGKLDLRTLRPLLIVAGIAFMVQLLLSVQLLPALLLPALFGCLSGALIGLLLWLLNR